MPKIVLISGTDRPDSKPFHLAKLAQKRYQELGIETEILDLVDYPFHATIGGSYDSEIPEIQGFNSKIHSADGLVFFIPEYNGSFPGALKLVIDHFPYPSTALTHKPIAYVGEGGGAFGGQRAVEHLQMVFNYLNAFNYPERVFIQRVNTNFDEKKGILDAFTAKLFDEQCIGFAEFVKKHSTSK